MSRYECQEEGTKKGELSLLFGQRPGTVVATVETDTDLIVVRKSLSTYSN